MFTNVLLIGGFLFECGAQSHNLFAGFNKVVKMGRCAFRTHNFELKFAPRNERC